MSTQEEFQALQDKYENLQKQHIRSEVGQALAGTDAPDALVSTVKTMAEKRVKFDENGQAEYFDGAGNRLFSVNNHKGWIESLAVSDGLTFEPKKAPSNNKAPDTGLRMSTMTDQQKKDYKATHGYEAYHKIPWS